MLARSCANGKEAWAKKKGAGAVQQQGDVGGHPGDWFRGAFCGAGSGVESGGA